MTPYQETFETWDKLAKLYADKFMDLELYDDTYNRFCEEIGKENPSILEIGCGPGNITRYLLKKRPDFQIEAIDISPNMLVLAKANNPTANFKVLDCRDIGQLHLQYDGIICGFCVPYLSKSDCVKLIHDCNNLLTAQGVLYISFVEGDYSQSGFQTGSSGNRTYFYYHPLEEISLELSKNRFKTIEIMHKTYLKRDNIEEIHTIVIAQKESNR